MGLEDNINKGTPYMKGNEVVFPAMDRQERDMFLNVMKQHYTPYEGMEHAYNASIKQLRYARLQDELIDKHYQKG